MIELTGWETQSERMCGYAAELLRREMIEVSLDAFNVNWEPTLEHILWQALDETPARIGDVTLDSQQVNALYTLAVDAGGWWVWPTDGAQSFVPLIEWRAMVSAE